MSQNVIENSSIPSGEAFQEDAVPAYARSADMADQTDALLLNVDGFEGPINVLLELARSQKVDLTKISILELVRQYLRFIERAQELNLELAAEYLVMASWLAYLKSRLLLPKEDNEEEASAEDMAAALQFQLRRLEAMQKAAETLTALPQLGKDVFARGMPEGLSTKMETHWNVSLYDLLHSYGNIHQRQNEGQYDLPEFTLMSAESAMQRVVKMLGNLPRKGMHSVWTTLHSFLPDGGKDKLYARSVLASTFTAGLELAKQGKLEMKQDGLFKPVYMRGIGDVSRDI